MKQNLLVTRDPWVNVCYVILSTLGLVVASVGVLPVQSLGLSYTNIHVVIPICRHSILEQPYHPCWIMLTHRGLYKMGTALPDLKYEYLFAFCVIPRD